MTPQEQQFKEIVRLAHKERGTILNTDHLDPFNFDIMKAAHNAVVLKCADDIESQRLRAETASSPAARYVHERNIDLDRTKESILRNLIP